MGKARVRFLQSAPMNLRYLPIAFVAGLVFAMHGVYAAGNVTGVVLKPTKTPLPASGTPVAIVGEPVSLTVLGSGSCGALIVDTGEGPPTALGANPQAAYFLPTNSTVTFHAAGAKEVKVKATDAAPGACAGIASARIHIAAAHQFAPFTLAWGDAGRNAGKVGERLVVSIGGSGLCANVQVDWGDGTAETAGPAVFPPTPGFKFQAGQHAYAKPGKYTLKVWDSGPSNCGGQAIVVTVG